MKENEEAMKEVQKFLDHANRKGWKVRKDFGTLTNLSQMTGIPAKELERAWDKIDQAKHQ